MYTIPPTRDVAFQSGIIHGRTDKAIGRRDGEAWLEHTTAYARAYWQGYQYGWIEA